MLMPKKERMAIYEHLFKEGVMVAEKDFHAPKHPELETIKNLHVIKAMQSLKSRGFVKEQFAWRHYYWYLTNEGIRYLRDFLHLPPEIVPSTLKRQTRTESARPKSLPSSRPEAGRSAEDRAAYRRVPGGADADKRTDVGPGAANLQFNAVERNMTCNEPLQLPDTNMSKPPQFDLGCEPKSSRSKKSDSGCVEGVGAGSLHSPKLTLSCSLISVIFSSSMLEEPNPPSYHTLQSSLDFDGGTSMARHLTMVVDSGAQDINKFPSYIYNHNDNSKSTEKSSSKNDLDVKSEMRSLTPKKRKYIPVDLSVVSNRHFFDFINEYKRAWGIPLQCKLVGGGETTLNSNSSGSVPGSANNNSPSSGASGAAANNNTNNNNSSSSNNWPAGHNPPSSGVAGNAWSAGGNGTNSGGRQQVGSNNSNNASHSSSTSQNIVKGGNNTGNQNQPSGPSQPTSTVATSWAQAAGKNLPPSSSSSNSSPGTNTSTSTTANGTNPVNNLSSPNGSGNGSIVNSGSSNSKQQIEDLKLMRDSLFATDGWGGQHVNQDSSWEVPGSPEPAAAKDAAGAAASSIPWKPNVNNGTDLWEANLRNGGQPPPQSTQKTPWGHTPTTNIGGTWGEDDDGESSNVWTGPSSSVPNPGVQQWGNAPSNPTPMWGSNKKEEWGNSGSGWNDPRELQRSGNGIDPRNNLVDSPHMRAVIDHRNIGGDSMIRNDPRGITGRINGSASSDPMWGGPPPQQPPGPGPHHHVTPTGPPPGPPAQASKLVPPGPGVSHWKELNSVGGGNLGRSAMQCPPGSSLPQSRMNASGMNSAAGAAVTGMKPDQLWTLPNRNGAWGDNGPHDMNTAPWATEDKLPPWNEPGLNTWNSAQKPKTPITPGSGWNENDVDPSNWGHVSKAGPKALTKDYVWGSKQFRILSDMNFKKDDIENALRASSMNLEDALEYLNATRAGSNVGNMDGWRRHDIDASPFDHSTNQAFSSHRFNPQQQLPFAVPPGGNGGGGNGANTPNISNLNPAMVQKILTHQPPPQPTSIQSFNQTSRSSQNQPSAHQLRMLVQQIQMAVSAGYLNHQILNQPLAPATLILLNNLLQKIKNLQQLQQQASQQPMYPGGQPNKSGAYMTLTVKQQQCKQSIQSLQSQIIAVQSVYMKQQQQQPQQPSQHLGGPVQQQSVNVNDLFKQQDPVSMLQGQFNDLVLKDPQMLVNPGLQNQSKLNQWKLPASMDKDDIGCNEFSRAPGTTSKPAPGSPNLNPLLVQTDSTWSNVSNRDGGWPESVNELSDSKDWSSPASTANFTDLVPEFEPGKPWKGSQMKSVEDDPNITPGSVVRSPLLALSTMKDSDIFNSPSNTTTSFENNESNGVYNLSKGNNANSGASKPGWGDVSAQPGAVTDLWGVPKSRGPPPGLTASKSSSQLVNNPASSSNGWASLGSPRWSMDNSQSPWMGSSWLLLRNLTPQIDGSTLKTLCMQHGPLNNFHLFLNHGIALAKYSSRDEASKAQGALNNCVLGNTTIFAESPAENEVHTLLQQLNQQSSSSNNNWSRSGGGGGGGGNNPSKPMQNSASAGSLQTTSDTWSSTSSTSQLWPSALWGAPQSSLETPDPHRGTPSSLNSFLPGDLLGGESM
ncbi:hypothetical protein V9T40_001684 [Parthenolecanium corni]|uniref:UBA domain-containing protein n=1 Tax=Parthenolecanium corni TaxID=536013 RepID=A0AAN9Y352_9HEMI